MTEICTVKVSLAPFPKSFSGNTMNPDMQFRNNIIPPLQSAGYNKTFPPKLNGSQDLFLPQLFQAGNTQMFTGRPHDCLSYLSLSMTKIPKIINESLHNNNFIHPTYFPARKASVPQQGKFQVKNREELMRIQMEVFEC